MIVDKQPIPGDDFEFQEAPPSYDQLDDVPPPLPEKPGSSSSHWHIHQGYSPVSPRSSIRATARAGNRPPSTSSVFGPSKRASKEVRATIQNLLRDLVQQTDPASALGVLESCAEACRSYNLALSALLQERAIEEHTPLYWAIVTYPSTPDQPDIISALLSHAAPLSDATREELRLACLHKGDNGLLQRLRRSPAFAPLSGSDKLVLGGNAPVDDVSIEDVPGDESSFVARFRIPIFQKRMRVSQEIALEFIAKGRLWAFTFLVVASDFDARLAYRYKRPGSWVVALSLLPNSPPTWIDSRLIIEAPRTRNQSSPPSNTTDPQTSPRKAGEGEEPKPNIELHMFSERQHAVIAVSLDEDLLAHSLQFEGCPYLESEGTLTARLEAKLVPPGADCVIC